MLKNFHTEPIEKLANTLRTNLKSGLTENEVVKRQEEYGRNKLKEGKPKSFFARFIEQISDFMVIVLIAAAVISFFSNERNEAYLILFIVIVNAMLGIIQESKAEKSLAAIKKLSSPTAKVIRDNTQKMVGIEDIVPGDIVIIDAGDYIPADIRIIESHSLKVDESALTGEAVPVEKQTIVLDKETIPLGDKINCGFMSTVVTYGRGKGLVCSTGMETEIGKIADMLNENDNSETPLQKNLGQLGKMLAIIALAICGIIFLIGVLEGKDVREMFITSISLAVAAIPEGLPAIVTIVLALGMQNLVKRRAIMRKLPAVETLGSTSIICSDKTGTLTQNKMTVEMLYLDNLLISVKDIKEIDKNMMELILFGVLCNDTKVAKVADNYQKIGDPTETALIDLAINLNIDPVSLSENKTRVFEIPFDSSRKLMTTVYSYNNRLISITKGAPDILLSYCDKDKTAMAAKANITMANDALRVLAFGYKELPLDTDISTLSISKLERNMTFIGLTGMIDPPRVEVKDAIKTCKIAGIKTIMITGDHKNTAIAIAKQLGILKDESQALSGVELDNLSDEDFTNTIENYTVYARVSPENKVRIVKTWRQLGHIVAMTGDGVNDAPALKSADIGVSMGITGTEVAKGASDMVLTDDNFATIVSAVEEGRTIFANIRKAIHFLLSCNIGEIFTILLATLFGTLIFGFAVTPLTATQILWINLVTDSLIAISLGLEKSEPNVMRKKPRNTRKSMFSEGLGTRIGLQGFLLGIISFLAYYIGYQYNQSTEIAMTMTFMTLAFTQLFHSFNIRSEDFSIFNIGIFSNKYLIGAFILSGILQLGTMLLPFTRNLFEITLLTIPQFLIVLLLSILPIIIVEVTKLINRNK